MTENSRIERGDRLADLAEKVSDVWEKILDAEIELINQYPLPKNPARPIFITYGDGHMEYREQQLSELGPNSPHNPDSSVLSRLNSQADFAKSLFEKAIWKSDDLLAPSRSRRSKKEQPAPPTYHATTRSQEEIEDFTDSILEGMREELDGIHGRRGAGQSEAAKKRQFISGDTGIYVKTGDEQFKKKVRNRLIAKQDELSQVVLWSAQAGGPRQAPFLRTEAHRISFVLEMINMDKLDERDYMDSETLWGLIDEAVEKKLLTDLDDPQITAKGLRHIKELFEKNPTKAQPGF